MTGCAGGLQLDLVTGLVEPLSEDQSLLPPPPPPPLFLEELEPVHDGVDLEETLGFFAAGAPVSGATSDPCYRFFLFHDAIFFMVRAEVA